MVSVGYVLSCAEFGPHELVHQARLAEEAGFTRLWITDHVHAPVGERRHRPFVWSVIGALSEAVSLPVTAAVDTASGFDPAIVAQAAATAAVQLDGRFVLAVGSAEMRDGSSGPTRLAELIEHVQRLLHGADVLVPVHLYSSDPRVADLAARIGDGYGTATPDPELVARFRSVGDPTRPVQSGLTAEDVAAGEHMAALRSSAAAGVDEVHVRQVGADQKEFFRIWAESVLPAFG